MSKKKVKKRLNLRMVFSLIINILLLISTFFLIRYILKLMFILVLPLDECLQKNAFEYQ